MSLLRSVQEEVLQRLARVGLAARHAVESMLAGRHRSLYRGLSVEFAGHRAYVPGDDPRYLDWSVYARTDRYDVKVFQEETRLRATLVLDASGSMGYGGGAHNKLAYARILAAALAFLMVRQGDSVGLAICDTRIRRHLPPGSTMGHLMQVLDALETCEAGGETALGPVLEDLAERHRRRGLIVLLSDCFEEVGRLVRSISHLHHRRQEVRMFQVTDPNEEEFPFTGYTQFIGLEREQELLLDSDRVRSRYLTALARHRQQLAAGCHEIGVPLDTCRTDEDPALALLRSLSRPAGRGRVARPGRGP